MAEKINRELQDQLKAVLAAGMSDEAMTAINKHVDRIKDDIETDVMYRLKDDLAPNLTAWVADMAQKAVAVQNARGRAGGSAAASSRRIA